MYHVILGHVELPGEYMTACKCQSRLAPNICVPYKFQDEVLTNWLVLLFSHAAYFHSV